jgi:hypothetical protein
MTGTLEIRHVGWNSSAPPIVLDLSNPAFGHHSGFVTMGDYNPVPDQYPADGGGGTTPTLSSLVEPGWIIGVARGMLPWFGAVKLLLQGNAQNVSTGSWQFLGLAIIAAILSAFGIHYALKTEGIESPLRRREEEESAAVEEDDEPRPPRRFLGAVRAWTTREETEDEADEPRDAPRRRTERESPRGSRARADPHRGRTQNRSHRSNRPRSDDENL